METIKSFKTYNTDMSSSWGIGQTTEPIDKTFDDVLKEAIKIKATLIVKPSRGRFWYIKGINNTKSYKEIKSHLETNLNSKYKSKSRTWLISYI